MNIPDQLRTQLRPFLLIPVIILGLLSIIATGGGEGDGGSNSNQKPAAVFIATPTSGEVPLIVNVDSSGSSDSDGSIASYAWNFGNGETGNGITSSTIYNNIGSYTITLTVTDNAGGTDIASTVITVGASSSLTIPIDQQIFEKYGVTMNSMSHTLAYRSGLASVMGNVESDSHAMFFISGLTIPSGAMSSGGYALQGGVYTKTP